MSTSNYPYRVFISYSRRDEKYRTVLEKALRRLKLHPVFDVKDVRAGMAYTEEINAMIATAHVFMPILTKVSMARAWVHQEIGFALGMEVPMIPLVVGSVLPDGMIAGHHALSLDGHVAAAVAGRLATDLEIAVDTVARRPRLGGLCVSSQVAVSPERRAELLVAYATAIRRNGAIRQRAIFSSFSLPLGGASNPAWDELESEQVRGSEYRNCLSEERAVLEKHVAGNDCYLILSPLLDTERVARVARRRRLQELLGFLRGRLRQRSLATVVAITCAGNTGGLTVVNDELAVTAMPPRPGSDYEQTLFTRHAPTVLQRLRRFDGELEAALAAAGLTPAKSLKHAIDWSGKALEQLGHSTA